MSVSACRPRANETPFEAYARQKLEAAALETTPAAIVVIETEELRLKRRGDALNKAKTELWAFLSGGVPVQREQLDEGEVVLPVVTEPQQSDPTLPVCMQVSESRTNPFMDHEFNLLHYWCDGPRMARYPTLYRTVVRVLTALLTSSPVERVSGRHRDCATIRFVVQGGTGFVYW